jgi:hypothetical protein
MNIKPYHTMKIDTAETLSWIALAMAVAALAIDLASILHVTH